MKINDNIIRDIIDEFKVEDNEFKRTLSNGIYIEDTLWKVIIDLLTKNNINPNLLNGLIDKEDDIRQKIIDIYMIELNKFLKELEIDKKDLL